MKLVVNIRKKLRNFELATDFSAENEVFALLGASGCGKSMTLKCIAGIETPDSGFIFLNDRILFDSEKNINLPPQKRKVGYLFQNYALFPNMTIWENIEFAATGTKEEKRQKTLENIRKFSLEGLENAYPNQLSGGQQQRVAFARILVADSEILLLDEPFSALDNYLKWQLELEFTEILKGYGGTAVLVSHDRGEVFRLADRIGVMNQGHLETVSGKHEVFADPKTLASTLLTGCKNISKAHCIDEHTLFAEEWGVELKVQKVPENLQYVAIRAHYFTESETDGENVFNFEVAQVIEDTFSYLVMVRLVNFKGKLLRWELEKDKWHERMAVRLKLPAEKLILLEK